MAGVRGYPRRDRNSRASCARAARAAFSRPTFPPSCACSTNISTARPTPCKSLFRDERQKVVSKLLGSTMDEAEAAYRQIYEHHAPLMGFLSDMGAPLPKMLHLTAEFVLNTALRKEFIADETRPGARSDPARHRRAGENPVGRSVAGLRPHPPLRPHGRRAGGQAPRRTAAPLQRRQLIWCARLPFEVEPGAGAERVLPAPAARLSRSRAGRRRVLATLDQRVRRARPEAGSVRGTGGAGGRRGDVVLSLPFICW